MERQDLPRTYMLLIMSWKAYMLSFHLPLCADAAAGKDMSHVAAYNGHLDVATTLLANGASSSAQDHKVC